MDIARQAATQRALNLWPPYEAIPGGIELKELKRSQNISLASELYAENILATIKVYVDGSCKDNLNIHDHNNPAGWGSYILTSQAQYELYGPVIRSPDLPFYVGANVSSNNTGEITALLETFLFLLHLNTTAQNIAVIFDSECAVLTVLGI